MKKLKQKFGRFLLFLGVIIDADYGGYQDEQTCPFCYGCGKIGPVPAPLSQSSREGSMSEWIKCSERMPPAGIPVIAWRRGGKNTDTAVFAQRRKVYGRMVDYEWIETAGGSYTYWGLSVDGSEVSHWQPLPAPPPDQQQEK